jgi:hypothetical protein
MILSSIMKESSISTHKFKTDTREDALTRSIKQTWT